MGARGIYTQRYRVNGLFYFFENGEWRNYYFFDLSILELRILFTVLSFSLEPAKYEYSEQYQSSRRARCCSTCRAPFLEHVCLGQLMLGERAWTGATNSENDFSKFCRSVVVDRHRVLHHRCALDDLQQRVRRRCLPRRAHATGDAELCRPRERGKCCGDGERRAPAKGACRICFFSRCSHHVRRNVDDFRIIQFS